MTPIERDKELREKLNSYFESVFSQGVRAGKDVATETYEDFDAWRKGSEVDEIMQLITADRKRVELEARIDELKQVSVDSWGAQHVPEPRQYRDGYVIGVKDLDERIAELTKELKAQQEKL